MVRVEARLAASRNRVLDRWIERVRAEIPSARAEGRPVLIDTLPAFLRHLEEALSSRHPRASASDGSSVPEEHGGERARLTGYSLEDLIREYQVLREVIFEILSEEGPLESSASDQILKSIDQAICQATAAYLLVTRTAREQLSLALTHDLRNPLTAARSSAQLILRRTELPEIVRWAGRVVENVDRADAMIRDLLDVSRLKEGQHLSLTFAPCELNAIARQAVTHLESMYGDRFVLVGHAPIQGVWSEEALRRAIENLGNNAVKYGSRDRPITLSVRSLEGRAIVSVHNHGSYIPAEQQSRLFDVFRRSRDAEQSGARGWGIGLALVRGVAEAHCGSITVDSLPERGTTFLMDIPLDPREAAGG